MTEKEKLKKWIKSWKNAGSALNKIKRDELFLYDYSKNQKIVDEMLQWAFENRKIRLNSGLVEQQRLFRNVIVEDKKE